MASKKAFRRESVHSVLDEGSRPLRTKVRRTSQGKDKHGDPVVHETTGGEMQAKGRFACASSSMDPYRNKGFGRIFR